MGGAMMIVPAGVKVHLALGYTDMGKASTDSPKRLMQDPFSGHLFALLTRRKRLLKLMKPSPSTLRT
jgi:transposase